MVVLIVFKLLEYSSYYQVKNYLKKRLLDMNHILWLIDPESKKLYFTMRLKGQGVWRKLVFKNLENQQEMMDQGHLHLKAEKGSGTVRYNFNKDVWHA